VLGTRAITGFAISAFMVWVLYGWSNTWFGLFLLVATGVCTWEWTALAGFSESRIRGMLSGVAGTLALGLLYFNNPDVLKYMVLATAVCWLLMVIDLFRRPVIANRAGANYPLLVLALFIVLTGVFSVYWLRGAVSPHYLFYSLTLIAFVDIGAYFSGRRFGRRKLAVQISQGKTVEGAIGGLLLALLLTLIGVWFFARYNISPGALLLASLVAAVCSIFGDLFISRAKRTAGVKDSGQFLPGHGGALDRVDGLLAGVPWLALVILWI